MKKWINNIGPGPLIAAAFIGPGTVTLCSIAGLNFGFSLLWTLALSVLATIVLQEMSARLGIISKKGLSEVIRDEIKSPRILQLNENSINKLSQKYMNNKIRFKLVE
jgi:manganese transport protein